VAGIPGLEDFAGWTVGTTEKSTQRGIGVYSVIDHAARDSRAVEQLEFSARHWSIAPVTTVKGSFDSDLATRFSKRTTTR